MGGIRIKEAGGASTPGQTNGDFQGSLQHLLSWQPRSLDTILRNYTHFRPRGKQIEAPAAWEGRAGGRRSGRRALKDASLSVCGHHALLEVKL